MKTQNRFQKPDAWTKLPLWKHQNEAVHVIDRYLKSNSDECALVRMPTGTGKTGIMAVLAQCFPKVKNVLVVAPWLQLIEQLETEIKTRFWKVMQVPATDIEKKVSRITSWSIEKIVKEISQEQPRVLVGTYQKIESLYRNRGEHFDIFKDKVDLILIDEGHREPAPRWAEAVRSFEKPIVLFSATPYRNDHRLFDIDKNHTFRLSHDDAENGRFIREVKFEEKEFDNPKSFVEVLLKFYDDDFRLNNPTAKEADRVIVRCETDNDVKQIASLLRKKGRKTIAIHERLGPDEDLGHARKVPDPKEKDAVFWVHQFKLIEGLDDKRFSLLAIYQAFGNDRTLIQQIGRVIRNPELKKNQKAFVFSHKRMRLMERWDAYRRYEEAFGGKIDQADPANIVQDIALLQEEYSYLEGRYRERFDLEEKDFYKYLSFRRSANIFQVREDFDFELLKRAIRDEVQELTFYYNEAQPTENTYVLCYVRYAPSPLLWEQTFMEVSLCYAVARQIGKFIFYYSSSSITPEYLLNKTIRVNPDQLERLLVSKRTRVTQLSLLNSDLGLYSVRRRSLSARAVENVAPGLADHTQFCSTVNGIIEDEKKNLTRRYVGFTRARVSQPAPRTFVFDDFLGWTDSVYKILQNERLESPEIFDRFALFVTNPLNPVPKHILFDVDDVAEDYNLLEDKNGEAPFLDDKCWEITNNEFTCTVNSEEVEAKVVYDSSLNRFEIISDGLSQLFVREKVEGERSRNLVAHLNVTQSFRIVTESGEIYSHGQFYKPRLALYGRTKKNKIDLLQIVHERDELDRIESEKGESSSTTGWKKGSVFEYIDRKSGGLFDSDNFKPDILVCDDLGNEIADFIAVQEKPPRICLVHAKADAKNSRLSASAFHDVCGQVTKNLDFLVPFKDITLKDPGVWNHQWRHSKIGVVKRRIRTPQTGMTAAQVMEKMRSLIQSPATRREVWIVISGGLSKSAFEEEIKKDKPKASTIQLLYLLQSAWSSTASIGATLKIFCRT